MTYWVSFYGFFFFGSLFCLIRVLLPLLLFSCPFVWNICFQPFTFSLCRSSVLRWVSCRQHMCGSCFLIHSAIRSLMGAFNPLTFKVITDWYLFVAIFRTCVSLSHCFSSCKPWSISCRAGLVEVYSFRLLLCGKLFIWLS